MFLLKCVKYQNHYQSCQLQLQHQAGTSPISLHFHYPLTCRQHLPRNGIVRVILFTKILLQSFETEKQLYVKGNKSLHRWNGDQDGWLVLEASSDSVFNFLPQCAWKLKKIKRYRSLIKFESKLLTVWAWKI